MIKEKIQINVSTVGKAMRERGGGGGGVGLSVDGGPWWTESATGLVGVEMHLGRLLLLIGYVPS